MKRKTYRNFIIIKNKLMREKGYGNDEASKLTHLVFDNTENDDAGRTAEYWYSRILSKAEYDAEYDLIQQNDRGI